MKKPTKANTLPEYHKQIILSYIQSLRKIVKKELHTTDDEFHTVAVPYTDGVVIEIENGKTNGNLDVVESDVKPSIVEAFKQLEFPIKTFLNNEEKRKFDEALKENSLSFSGTNIYIDHNKLYLIKEYNEKNLWTMKAAERILNVCLRLNFVTKPILTIA